MYRRILAFDYDGTLAENGHVPPALQQALSQLHLAGYALFLVTGRQVDSVRLGSLNDLFTGIVWENGAVLSHLASHETYLPFGHVDPRLVEALEAANVPLEHGRAIVATWLPYEETVWHVLQATGIDVAVVHNKGALMLLPPGAAKGTGLERMLTLCGFSVRNLVCFGDGENDLSLLQVGETGVAVADAVPSVKESADWVTSQPGPAGVLEALERYWLHGEAPALPARHEHLIPLGEDAEETPYFLSGAQLISGNLGVFGDSSSGKSWATGLVAEGMHMAGYQTLLIDTEGDYRGLRSLPGFMVFNGDEKSLPTPASVMTLLEATALSMVLDLCTLSMRQRELYVADLFHALRPLREHKFRPHWIVLEEAQQFVATPDSTTFSAIQPMLPQGGWAFVSYRPDWLDPAVLTTIDRCLITRLSIPEALRALPCRLDDSAKAALAQTPQGYLWASDGHLVRLHLSTRRIPHIRHLYKYLDLPLPRAKRFYFRTEQGYLGCEAASLFEFKELLASLPSESLAYHQTRGDFAAWVHHTLGDEILAAHLDKLARRPQLKGEALRQALLQRVTAHYMEIQS